MRQGSTLAMLGLSAIVALGSSSLARGQDHEAPLPDSRLGQPTQPLLLLSRPDVRHELHLTNDQVISAQRAIRSFYVQAYRLRGKPNTAETVQARRAVDEAATGWIETQLSPEQASRLVQIHLQWEGPAALVKRPVVCETLRLSDDQKALIQAAITRRDQARLRGDASADTALAEDVLRCLSKSQGESWRQMMGDPFHPVRTAATDPAKTTR